MATALSNEPEASTTAPIKPKTMSEKYSAGPNLKASSVSGGANAYNLGGLAGSNNSGAYGGVISDSFATGSVIGVGDGFAELYVFEVGVSESSRVEISTNGADWINVGQIGGGSGNSLGVFSYGFDIDKLGYGLSDSFTYVRLTDLQIDGTTSPQGADIDAVGAISSVPAPASVWLLLTGLAGLANRSVRVKRRLRAALFR